MNGIIEYIKGLIEPSIMKRYLNEMHKQHNYFATWPVYEHLKLGDVGILQNNQFTRLTNLKNLGIDYTEIVDTGSKADLLYTSDEGVKQLGTFGVDVAPPGVPVNVLNADISIYFEKSNSIFFSAPDITISHIDDKNLLGFKILQRFNENNKYGNEKKWNLDWVVITDLQYSKTATFLISNGDKSYVALKAGANVPPELVKSLKCDLTIQNCKNVAMQVFAKDGVTPLFKGIKLEKVSWDIFKTDIEPKNLEVKTFSYIKAKDLLKEPTSIIISMDIKFQDFDLKSNE